jgi:ferredoxin/flavodoxin---NADP+ reductase
VSFGDWATIDAAERSRGALCGKPREKFVSVPDMLAAADA